MPKIEISAEVIPTTLSDKSVVYAVAVVDPFNKIKLTIDVLNADAACTLRDAILDGACNIAVA